MKYCCEDALLALHDRLLDADVECPLSCGQCCSYWRDVLELQDDAVTKPPYCPHEGRDGCELSRAERPSACLGYLCGVAQGVIEGTITHEHGLYLKERCIEDVPR